MESPWIDPWSVRARPQPPTYTEVFRTLIRAWGRPRRDLECPYWVSRDGAALVACEMREPGRAGITLWLRCYGTPATPVRFIELVARRSLSVAVLVYADLQLGNMPPALLLRESTRLRSGHAHGRPVRHVSAWPN